MTRTHIILLIGCFLSLLICSCNKQRGARSVDEISENLIIVQPDTSLRGTLNAITPDSLRLTAEYDNAPISCTYDEARGNSQIFGSLTEGHRYALLVNPATRDALKIYNLTELSGQWFFDTAEGRGFTFTAAGALSSINPKDVSMKKWKFYNGHIIIYYVDINDVVNDSRNYKSDTTEIQSLSADNLVFRFRGQPLRCTRQHGAIKFHM